jgi:hypothetical protein
MVYENFRQLRACLVCMILKMRGQENMNIARLDGIWSRATMFVLSVWFQRERCEALQLVAIVGHVFSPVVKSVAERMAWNPRSEDWYRWFESWYEVLAS